MIIQLTADKPFVEFQHFIKYSNNSNLHLLNGGKINTRSHLSLDYEDPIILTPNITYLFVAREITSITIVPNKNLLTMKFRCQKANITKINSKLSRLIFINYYRKPLELTKKLSSLIFYHYNKHLILPKHLKYLSLYYGHSVPIIFPPYIKTFKYGGLMNKPIHLDKLSNNLTLICIGFHESFADNLSNNICDVHVVCIDEKLHKLMTNNVPNSVEKIFFEDDDYQHTDIEKILAL